MVFNNALNNIPVISWRSVLLMEETTDLVIDRFYHIMMYRVYITMNGIRFDRFDLNFGV